MIAVLSVAALAPVASLVARPRALLSSAPPGELIPELKEDLAAEVAGGFSSRGSLASFDARLRTPNAPDPCKARLLTGGLGAKSGLGARMGLAAEEVQLATYFGVPFAVCDGDASNAGIGWSARFANPLGLPVCESPSACIRGETEAAWIGRNMTNALAHVDFDFQVGMKRSIFRALFTYTVAIQARVDAAIAAAGLPEDGRYVALHVRRGDKAAEARRLPTETYAQAALGELRGRGLRTLFVGSDDGKAAEELLAQLGPQVPGIEVVQRFSPTSSDREYSDDAAMLALLTDVAAMRRAESFIGTQSSSLSRLVFFLRDGSEASTSLDGGWLDSFA